MFHHLVSKPITKKFQRASVIHRFSNIKALILIAFLATSLTGEAFASPPSEIVERFHATLLEVMKEAKIPTVR